MGQRIKTNFEGQFGNRINILYTDRPLRASEQYIQNGNICKAFSDVLAGIIGREPSEAELFGIKNIEKDIKKTNGGLGRYLTASKKCQLNRV